MTDNEQRSLPSLTEFSQMLRPYQRDVVNDAIAFANAVGHFPPGPERRRIYAAPTGSGKGSMILALAQAFSAAGVSVQILTPKLDIIRGFLERCGVTPEQLAGSKASIERLAEGLGIMTPTRFRNLVAKGETRIPAIIIADEVQHSIESNEVSGFLFAACPYTTWLGFTATPYRASPRSTAKLLEDWGEPIEVMNFREAVEAGYVAMPTVRVVPLVDDDKIKVAGGDFQVKRSTSMYKARLDQLAELISGFYVLFTMCHFDKPTMVACPSTEICHMLAARLDETFHVPAAVVVQDTKAQERAEAYAATRDCRAVLIQINVVSEGVDLPWLERLIDAKPTQSPVAWLQQVGRITRPGGAPEYICTNRNLERHAYLLGGIVPTGKIGEAQEAFGGPSKRAGSRHIGLESLQKFKALQFPLADGSKATGYNVYAVDERTGDKVDYMVVVLPGQADPIVGQRRNRRLPDGRLAWGKWQRAELPADFVGFATSKATYRLTPKQKAWWDKAAGWKGLCASSEGLKARQFAVLPFLSDLGLKIEVTQ